MSVILALGSRDRRILNSRSSLGYNSNFKAILHYLRPYLKEKKKKNHIVLFAQVRL